MIIIIKINLIEGSNFIKSK